MRKLYVMWNERQHGLRARFFMAGDEGFEPPNTRFRVWCLNTWPIPNAIVAVIIEKESQKSNFILWKRCFSYNDTRSKFYLCFTHVFFAWYSHLLTRSGHYLLPICDISCDWRLGMGDAISRNQWDCSRDHTVLSTPHVSRYRLSLLSVR